MPQHFNIPALDKYPLPSIFFEAVNEAKGLFLICPGLGIPKEFYVNYAEHCAKQAYHALVFDYRGISTPKQASIDPDINLFNWGLKDMPGLINWLKNQYPNLPLYFLAHSIAGQFAGLIPNYHLVERFFMISSTGGHWTLFNFPLNIFSIFLFNIHIPITTKILGYMPKSLTYRGVSIAKGVALEWAEISRKKAYIKSFFGNKIPQNYYAKINQPIDWLWFADDSIATPRAVKDMMDYYTNAPIKSHFFEPDKLGLSRIGHAGFFHPKAGTELWSYPIKLIEEE